MTGSGRLRRIGATIAMALLASSWLSAYQFSPLEQTFEPSGGGATSTYTIVNDSDDTIAVRISALTRDQDADGGETNSPATNYFSIRPANVLVGPQASQVVRVTYRGPRMTPNELAFRIKAEQVEYSKGRKAGGTRMFNFLYNYVTSAYIQPQRPTEKLSVSACRPVMVSETPEEGGEPVERKMLAVTIRNEGNVHQTLDTARLTVTDGDGRSVTLEGAGQLGPLYGMNILARKTVTLHIPFPEGISGEDGTQLEARLGGR